MGEKVPVGSIPCDEPHVVTVLYPSAGVIFTSTSSSRVTYQVPRTHTQERQQAEKSKEWNAAAATLAASYF